jgi:hypothetical protein
MNNATRKKSRFLTPAWMMFGSALLCVVLVPVLHAAMNQSGLRAERLQELRLMTASERLRIEHQFERFQKMSPADQQRYRDLHNQLNGEQVALKTTLADYKDFLVSLNPVERGEIEQKSDLNQRVLTIKRIQEEREYRQQQLDLGLAEADQRRSSFLQEMNRHGGGQKLSDDDMQAIGAVIQANLPTNPSQKASFEKSEAATRYALVLTAALKTWEPKPTGVNRQPFPEEIVEEMVGAIENEILRSKLQKFPKKEFQIFALVMMSERALLSEYMEDVPTTSKLQEFLETRDPEEKKKLMQKEPGQMYFDLVEAYRDLNPTPLSQSISELRQQIQTYRDAMRPPRGPGRDDERGPGGRRGPGGFGGRDSEPDRPGGRERPKPPEGRQPERSRDGGPPLLDRLKSLKENRE